MRHASSLLVCVPHWVTGTEEAALWLDFGQCLHNLPAQPFILWPAFMYKDRNIYRVYAACNISITESLYER